MTRRGRVCGSRWLLGGRRRAVTAAAATFRRLRRRAAVETGACSLEPATSLRRWREPGRRCGKTRNAPTNARPQAQTAGTSGIPVTASEAASVARSLANRIARVSAFFPIATACRHRRRQTEADRAAKRERAGPATACRNVIAATIGPPGELGALTDRVAGVEECEGTGWV